MPADPLRVSLLGTHLFAYPPGRVQEDFSNTAFAVDVLLLTGRNGERHLCCCLVRYCWLTIGPKTLMGELQYKETQRYASNFSVEVKRLILSPSRHCMGCCNPSCDPPPATIFHEMLRSFSTRAVAMMNDKRCCILVDLVYDIRPNNDTRP